LFPELDEEPRKDDIDRGVVSAYSEFDEIRGPIGITLGVLAIPIAFFSIFFSLMFSIVGLYTGRSAWERKQGLGKIAIIVNLVAIVLVFAVIIYYLAIGKPFLDPYLTDW
jgi:hypothetical protein